MHGVHPAPNTIPTTTEPAAPEGLVRRWTRKSRASGGSRTQSRSKIPKTMTTTPPTRVMVGSIRLNAWPAAVADAPRVMKTRRKPRMKSAAWSTAVRRAVAAEPSDSSSIVRPETKLK